MVDVSNMFKIELYVLLIILVIVLIIIGIRFIITLNKIDKTIDNVNDKLNRVDGAFDVVGKTADFVDGISNNIINAIMGVLGKFINKKKGHDEDE